MLPNPVTTLTGTYASGFSPGAFTLVLNITPTGFVEGGGVYVEGPRTSFTVYNNGRIKTDISNYNIGIDLQNVANATVTNGSVTNTSAYISGSGIGIWGQHLSVKNTGTIKGGNTGPTSHSLSDDGVLATAGCVLTNGAAVGAGALIEGYVGVQAYGGPGSVTNFGVIKGVDGVDLITGAVTNYGVIETSVPALSPGNYILTGRAGVVMGSGLVTNESANDTPTLIAGIQGVEFTGAGTVLNFGSITGTYLGSYLGKTGTTGYAGVRLEAGGSVTNGSALDKSARITGGYGVWAQKDAGTVTNYGLILGRNARGVGIRLDAGGDVVNGSVHSQFALVTGAVDGVLLYASGAVDNFGTIIGGTDFGVGLAGQGTLVNGAVGDTGARIEGYNGVALLHESVGSNSGTIVGNGGAGAIAYVGSSLGNSGLIEGATGVELVSGSTLTNSGTIVGTTGTAVEADATSLLVVDAGSAFVGAVTGDLGTVDLGNDLGAVSLLTNGDVVLASGTAAQTLTNFGTVEIGASARLTLTGTGVVASGKALDIAGDLSVAGAFSVTGELTLAGSLSGAGLLTLSGGGQAVFDTGASLTLARVSQTGATSLAMTEINEALTYAGKWTQTTGTLSTGIDAPITFTGVDDSFAGTLAGAITFGGGTQALKATMVDANLIIAAGDKTTVQGAITFGAYSYLTIQSAAVVIAATGASFTGGSVNLTAGGRVIGAATSSLLTNISSEIVGAGLLGGGKMALVNDALGVIAADSAVAALVINIGANTIANAGQIESLGAGGLMIESVLNNGGEIVVSDGVLTATQAVTGAGTVAITGATADFASGFSENVSFGSTVLFGATSGVLELGQSQGYKGTISGFSTTGTTSLDLQDIAFGAKTKGTYSGTSTSGVLTVTDGTHTASITLHGDYAGTSFTARSDEHGGTTLTASTSASVSAGRFIAAMAGFGANASAVAVAGPGALRGPEPMLTAPPS